MSVVALALFLAVSSSAHESAHKPAPGVIMTQAQALNGAFGGVPPERKTLFLTAEQNAGLASRLDEKDLPSIVTYYVGKSSGSEAFSFFERRRTFVGDAVLMTLVRPDGRLASVRFLAFEAAADHMPDLEWLARFEGKSFDEIRALPSGSSNDARLTAVRAAVRATALRSLALFETAAGS